MSAPSAPGTLSSTWTSSSCRTKHRRSHYGLYAHRPGPAHGARGCCLSGDVSMTFDLRALHLQRQFSEDSGFSSCGSSASSGADEMEAAPGHTESHFKKSVCPTRSSNWNASSRCGSQSGTVASVLAAGVSDSEETDHCESDDDDDVIEGSCNMFKSHGIQVNANQFRNITNKSAFSLPNSGKTVSQVRQLHSEDKTRQETLQLHHLGRDILDLGTNVRMMFPMRATELPDRNLPLFLQNRSQYHRLGNFGTTETLSFANCKKQCGFSYPIPPREELLRGTKSQTTSHFEE